MNKIAIILATSLLLTSCSQEVKNPYAEYVFYPPIELNPCPMCGEKVSIGDYRYGYWIYCDNCLLHTGNYESLDELVNTWNKVESRDKE